MKHLLMPAFLLLILLATGCPPKPPDIENQPASTAPPKQVFDPERGVSIMVPEDWKIVFKPGNPFIFAMAPGAGDYGPMVNVVVEDLSQRMHPYDYLQANIPTLRLSLPQLAIDRSGIETQGGINLAWIVYSYPRGAVKVWALAYAQTVEFKAYVTTGIAPEELFKPYETAFRSIGRSLRVEPGR